MRQLPIRPALSSRTTRRQPQPNCFGTEVVPPRFLEHECYAALVDRTDSREARLLQASNERFDRVTRADPAGDLVRLTAFESGYLALASVLKPEEVADEAHPSVCLVARTTGRLPLLAEDALLAAQLTNVHRLDGWETLDLDAITEWCSRVRLAVGRYLQAR